MLEVDFHSHTTFSRCGLHTVIEMLTRARELGMLGLAITDHGPELKGSIPSPFWDRLTNPVPGVRLLKGMECNVINNSGDIDYPLEHLQYTDIVLLGLHPNLSSGLDQKTCTDMLLKALDKNKYVDIVTHPNDETFPLDLDRVAQYAAKAGIALELNNSKSLLNRVAGTLTTRLLEACKKARCLIAVNSDAHAIGEVGLDDSAQAFLAQVKFPREYIVNRDATAAFGFVEKRREVKRDVMKNLKR